MLSKSSINICWIHKRTRIKFTINVIDIQSRTTEPEFGSHLVRVRISSRALGRPGLSSSSQLSPLWRLVTFVMVLTGGASGPLFGLIGTITATLPAHTLVLLPMGMDNLKGGQGCHSTVFSMTCYSCCHIIISPQMNWRIFREDFWAKLESAEA